MKKAIFIIGIFLMPLLLLGSEQDVSWVQVQVNLNGPSTVHVGNIYNASISISEHNILHKLHHNHHLVWIYWLQDAPAGMSMDINTGQITWTAPNIPNRTYSFTVMVREAIVENDTNTFVEWACSGSNSFSVTTKQIIVAD